MRPFPEILLKKTQLEREYLEALEGLVFEPCEYWRQALTDRKTRLQACRDLLQALFQKPELKDE